MQTKLNSIFAVSAGVMLLALATAMFISNGVAAGFVQPHDPLLLVSMRNVFWLLGLIELAVALVCLFGHELWLKLGLIFWISMTLVIYQFGLLWVSGPRSLGGYWGDLAYAFGVSPNAVCWILRAIFLYLLAGNVVLAAGSRVEKVLAKWRNTANCYLKNSCGRCGGHIEFPVSGVGQRISCPHCAAALTLRRPPETLT